MALFYGTRGNTTLNRMDWRPADDIFIIHSKALLHARLTLLSYSIEWLPRGERSTLASPIGVFNEVTSDALWFAFVRPQLNISSQGRSV